MSSPHRGSNSGEPVN